MSNTNNTSNAREDLFQINSRNWIRSRDINRIEIFRVDSISRVRIQLTRKDRSIFKNREVIFKIIVHTGNENYTLDPIFNTKSQALEHVVKFLQDLR